MTTYKLKLIHLYCGKTEDNGGVDQPYLRVNDRKVWGPVSLEQGSETSLEDVQEIAFPRGGSRTVIRLYEKDKGVFDGDDFLGAHTAYGSEADGAERTATFTEDEANYTLTYKVLRE